jgi:mannitol-1-phosphate/altronate dehydrogenase
MTETVMPHYKQLLFSIATNRKLNMKLKVVIIGAGALGLGFLAERLARDYELCLVDTKAKAGLLCGLAGAGAFVVNICGPDGIEKVRVPGPFTTVIADDPAARDKYQQVLREADLILTATRRSLLDALVPAMQPAISDTSKKRWLLFCENGLDIAAAFAPQLGSAATPMDTVMSRMCRFAERKGTEYQPLFPGAQETLVVEEYSLLPIDKNAAQGGPFTDRFHQVSNAEFLCWEDIKLYLHNGMHAFVSYHAFLEGAWLFVDTPQWLRDLAGQVAQGEVVPAIVQHHPQSDAKQISAYAHELLARFFNPYFKDSIARGVRGVAEKLAPGERLRGGVEYIRQAGIEPKGYAKVIDAAQEILRRAPELA